MAQSMYKKNQFILFVICSIFNTAYALNETSNHPPALSKQNNPDAQMIAFLKNPNISRRKKIDDIWESSKSKDYQQFAYMVDTLGFLNASEKIPEFIAAYNKEKHIKRKLRLISLVADSTMTRKIMANQDKNRIANIILAQEFITQLLKNEQNAQILNHTIWQSMHVLPMNQENYFLASTAINRLQASPEKNHRLPLDEKYRLIFSMAFANVDMQKWLLPKLLSMFVNPDEKFTFNQELFFIINQLTPMKIDKEMKAKIENILIQSLYPAANQMSCLTNYMHSAQSQRTLLLKEIKRW